MDPRGSPAPEAGAPPPRFTAIPGQLTELLDLCKAGRLYDVESWIRNGSPLQLEPGTQARGPRRTSALQIALGRGDHALVYLLLCNGYAANAEESSPLDCALESRRIDLVDLLLAWGTDPHQVSRTAVFETYSSALMERFRSLGVDMTDGHEMAEVLAERTSNKPLFGFARRHRQGDPKVQRELDMALVHHAGAGNEKGVMLCLWAGADPYARAPDLRWPIDTEEEEDDSGGVTAIWQACIAGHVVILERLDPDPSRLDYDDLYRWSRSAAVIDVLARRALPREVSAVVAAHIPGRGIGFLFSGRSPSVYPLRRLFELGMRWTSGTNEEIANVRRSLLRTTDDLFGETLKLLTKGDHCAPEILRELARTPAFQRKMVEAGFMPRPTEDHQKWQHRRQIRSNEVLSKCGLGRPGRNRSGAAGRTPAPSLPRVVRVGYHNRSGREVRLTRRDLFERVWSTPTTQLAAEWGLSDQGLAKVCRRLRIPRPQRGYWAKKQAGQNPRRPTLPKVREGEAEEILVRVPR